MSMRLVFLLAALLLSTPISAQDVPQQQQTTTSTSTSTPTPPIFAQGPSGPPKPVTTGTGGTGQGVDRYGGPVVDPTENVKALSEAANKRQDDLRQAYEKMFQIQLTALNDTSKLRDEIEKERSVNNRELREAEIRRIDAEAKLRSEYSEKLSVAEAKRIDAIRVVDVNAVAVASQRASDQATVLATQVAQSAEALRTLVATTAATVAASQQQLANTLSARITTLEQAGYQQQGTAKFQDPQIAALVSEVKALSEANRSSLGVGAGRGDVIGWIVAGILLLIAIVGSIGVIITIFIRSRVPVPVHVDNGNGPASRRRA